MAWKKFPYDAADFDYSPAQLKKHWKRLHRGDAEAFPDAQRVQALAAESGIELSDAEASASALLEAWRAYHRGDYEAAREAGLALGPLGWAVSNKATGMYATYLCDDEDEQLALYQEIAERAEAHTEQMPEYANAWYLHAFALGRYGQGISITKALSQGLGGKVKKSLDRTLELEPDHADAHTASGLYHAEIIDKVGKMVGSLTYGASRDEALRHFRRASQLFPESAITRMEQANGLLLLHGDKAYDEASRLYVEASECSPMDATEWLDVEAARAELE